MKTAVIACVHGNEQYGLEVIKMLPPSCSFFIANKKAIEENKRFIDTDLNRCFPGKKEGNNEEKIAYELMTTLNEFDEVIDLHSTSEECPLFGIITKPNNEKIELAKRLGLQKLVIMSPGYASGRALIDFVKKGISLEVGPHERKENVQDTVNAIKSLVVEATTGEIQLEIYEVFDIIRGEGTKPLIGNFDEVKKGQPIAILPDKSMQEALFDFIAILVGEKSYNNVICLACRKGKPP